MRNSKHLIRMLAIPVIVALTLYPLLAQDEAALKQRILGRSQAVVDLLTSGAVMEGTDGLLKPNNQLEQAQSQLMQEENKDRQAVFTLIAAKAKIPIEDVGSMYSKKARAKWPPQQAAFGAGPCKLVPAKAADAARLLQYLKQGMNYASQKKYELALAEFQQALAIDKNFLSLNQNVGVAQLALKKYPEAEAAFKAEAKLVDCLAPLSENQLVPFAYYVEIAEQDPVKRKSAQASKLKSDISKAKADVNYNMACLYSLKKEKEPALDALRTAINSGFANKQALKSDPDLAYIRPMPEFREIVSKVR
jgi:tetratricopeptide (TPR) repeat protein